MNRLMAGPALLLVAVLMTGCAANVVTDYDTSIAYDSYETWAFGPSEDNRYTSLDGSRVEDAVSRALEAKALTRTEPESADLLVSYHIDDVDRLDTSGFSYGIGFGRGSFGWGLSTAPPVREVREGQLIVDLVDASTDKVVWRGTSKRYLNQNQSPETRHKLINEVVADMFSRYPPGE
ncbi:DUF4136 domain-containing protein [Marinobacter lacisalsi]|uniref:DUF4136 domain-containing protein n=1 Tax=Marinobacter lacisalsi TaxID=475979 RepID=A0ABV8QJW8_9GAMM